MHSKALLVRFSLLAAMVGAQISAADGVAGPQTIDPAEARAGGEGVISQVIPFAGVFVGLSARNRVYREANTFIAERSDYYDRLRAKAQEQLKNRELIERGGSQLGAYTKVVALIEQERQATNAFAESEKRAAREAFIRRVQSAIIFRVSGTEAVRTLFNAMRRGVNSSKDAINTALDALGGNRGGVLAELEKARRVASRVRAVGAAIGGPTGQRIARISGRIAAAIQNPQQAIAKDLESALGDLDQLGDAVETLDRIGRVPNVGGEPREVVIQITDASQRDPALEAIISLLSGSGRQDASLRERARTAILAGSVARCALIGDKYLKALKDLLSDEAVAGQVESDVFSGCRAVSSDDLAPASGGSGTPIATASSETPAAMEASLTLIQAEITDHACTRPSPNTNYSCMYTIRFDVAYIAPASPATLTCSNTGVFIGDPMTLAEGSGTTTFVLETGAWSSTPPGQEIAAGCVLTGGTLQTEDFFRVGFSMGSQSWQGDWDYPPLFFPAP